MQKERRGGVVRLRITPCVQHFDTRGARVGNGFARKSRQNGMNLSWPCSIPGLLLVCSLSLAGILWCYW